MKAASVAALRLPSISKHPSCRPCRFLQCLFEVNEACVFVLLTPASGVVAIHIPLNPYAEFFHVEKDVSVEVLVLEDRPKRLSGGMVKARVGLTH